LGWPDPDVPGKEGDDFAFLKEAVGSLSTPGLWPPILLIAVLQPATNILILSNLPTQANPDHAPYVGAFVASLVGHAALALAMLRILNGSPRPAWRPDSSAWAYGLALLGTVAVGLFADWIIGPPSAILPAIAAGIVFSAMIVPLSPWLVAIAVERPLAWRPAPWFGRLRAWLPALLLWNFLILVPANALYRIGFGAWLDKGGQDEWLFYIVDGLVTAARISFALALASVAYRRVARV
jgi:hypothetical protein